MKIKTMTRMALLSAIALTIFWVEAQIPMPISVPGVKLGLANVVTVYAVFSLGAWEAGGILLVRVLLGSLFTGQMMSLLYSAVGGVLALLTALGLKRILTGTQIWVASCFSAVAHNLGQIAVAIAITRTPALCPSYFSSSPRPGADFPPPWQSNRHRGHSDRCAPSGPWPPGHPELLPCVRPPGANP